MAEAEKQGKSIVEVAKDRYDRASDFYSPNRMLALEDTRFAMGDSDNGWQWPAEIYRDRSNVNKKPCLTINTTAQHCNQIINNIRQNRPAARVLPVDNGADKKTAEILAGMIRSTQSVSTADTAHDLAAEHAIYGGEGYWRVVTEYESHDSFNQIILIKAIPNPRLVFIDPDAIEPDRSDAKWGFVFEDIPRAKCEEEYPDLDCTSWGNQDPRGWVQKDMIRRAEYFWCEYIADKLYQLENGAVVLESDLPEGAKVYGKSLNVAGQMIGILNERATKRKQWKWCKLVGGSDKPIEERDWPGSYLPIITVVGKELNVDGQIIRKGIVRDLKDSARMVNYSYSAAVETLALQNKVPYLASAEAIEGFESIWGAANLDNRAYLPWNEYDEQNRQISMPKRQEPATMPAAQVQMLQLSTEQMRAASGQQNANFGIKSEAQSGIGIQRLKVQGETATFHFPDNLVRALKYEAKVLIDLYPKVLDTKQIVRMLGLDGVDKKAMLDPDLTAAYVESTEKDIEGIFNPNVGKYDVTIDTGPSFQTQRQEASAAMTEIASKDPAFMQIAGDLYWRNMDVPGSDELAKRYEKILPPALQEDGGDQVAMLGQKLQAAEQTVMQAKELVSAMNKEIQSLTAKANAEKTKIITAGMAQETAQEKQEDEHNVKVYQAETERLKTLVANMSPEAMKPLIRQTILEILSSPPLPEEVEALRDPVAEPEPLEVATTPEMAATGAQPGPV
jgi:hypothetical protein